MSKIQVYKESEDLWPLTKKDLVKEPNGDSSLYAELYGPQAEAMRQTKFVSPWSTYYGKALNFLFFSDIHGDGINLQKIMDFRKTSTFFDDVLFGGDFNNSPTDDMSFWTDVEGTDKILVAIGNHDNLGASVSYRYNKFIGPYAAGWGATFQSGVCYYYKDYTDQKVRLIVLDCTNWTSAQNTWLVNTLASAKTAGYHVMCMSHFPAGPGQDVRTCPFDLLGAQGKAVFAAAINAEATTAVQNFIDGGGIFICWLAGHLHADLFRTPTNYPKQMQVIVANASCYAHVGASGNCQLDRVVGERSEELYDLISINPVWKTFTVVRVGADRDNFGRHMGWVTYDYANNVILSQG